jgi:hypothetical protein
LLRSHVPASSKITAPMSALGQKQTLAPVRIMSALRPKADIRQRDLDPSSSLDAAHNIIL